MDTGGQASTTIVVVSPALPLPFGRADARWLHAALLGLAAEGHDVVCISCTKEGPDLVEEAASVAAANAYRFVHVPFRLDEAKVLRRIRSLLRPRSELARCVSLQRAVDDARSGKASILHLEHLFTSWLGLNAERAVTFVHHLEVVDWEDRTDLTRGERLGLVQMRRATHRLVRSGQPLVVASDRLAREVRARGGPLPTPVVPVAVDPTLYPMVPPVAEPVVGVVGSMHWYPSRAAAERVLRLWPRIRARVPDARLLVAGWNSERLLSHWFPLEGAELLGAVERPEDFFARISVLLYPPPKGSGMKIKVLEALAYGVPVISNDEGFEGLHVEDGRDACRVETDDDIVDRTVALLLDPCLRAEMRSAGRELVERSHSPGTAARRLLQAYDELQLR